MKVTEIEVSRGGRLIATMQNGDRNNLTMVDGYLGLGLQIRSWFNPPEAESTPSSDTEAPEKIEPQLKPWVEEIEGLADEMGIPRSEMPAQPSHADDLPIPERAKWYTHESLDRASSTKITNAAYAVIGSRLILLAQAHEIAGKADRWRSNAEKMQFQRNRWKAKATELTKERDIALEKVEELTGELDHWRRPRLR